MKAVGLLSNDIELKAFLEQTERFNSVELIDEETFVNGLHDIYIISDQVMPFNNVKSFIGQSKGKPIFLYGF